MTIDVNPLHKAKAWRPILETDSGMDTEISPLQPLKASSPIHVILLGINEALHPATKVLLEVSNIALQLSREL